MTRYVPSLTPCDASRTFSQLIKPSFDEDSYLQRIQSMQRMYTASCASCPALSAGYGLHITAELHYQSEHWLPLDQLRPHFYRFYHQALTYPPVLSSTPFAHASSWAAIVSRFPPFLQKFENPALLLQQLLVDGELRHTFLAWSFMPERFYGDGSDRYPEQAAVIAEWLSHRPGRVRCLDAACGDGAGTYGLARLLLEQGRHPDRFMIEGWTRDPLEVWAAAHGAFPHHPEHEKSFKAWVAPVFDRGAQRSMLFKSADLLALADSDSSGESECFDLIVCNGLLGGPIINCPEDIRRIVSNLSCVLASGGMLLVADRFHGGWKKNIPAEILEDVLKAQGLLVADAGEGRAALKSDQ